MITKITCRYSFEVLDFHCNDFGFTFNIGVSYLGIYKTSMVCAVIQHPTCHNRTLFCTLFECFNSIELHGESKIFSLIYEQNGVV